MVLNRSIAVTSVKTATRDPLNWNPQEDVHLRSSPRARPDPWPQRLQLRPGRRTPCQVPS